MSTKINTKIEIFLDEEVGQRLDAYGASWHFALRGGFKHLADALWARIDAELMEEFIEPVVLRIEEALVEKALDDSDTPFYVTSAIHLINYQNGWPHQGVKW